MPPIPALRDDIEFRRRSDGSVDIRDPHLLQILSVDGEDFSVAQCFDGKRDARAVQELLSDKRALTKREILDVAEEFEDLKLLDTPAVWKAEPIKENLAPHTQFSPKKGLHVLPVGDPGAHWTCHGCGSCCHGLAVELSKEEEARIDITLYRDVLGDEHFAEDSFLEPDEGVKRTLRQKSDENDACIFLAPNGLCYVHARQGMEAKPNACQMFPLMVVQPPRQQPRIGVRVNCQSMYKSHLDGPSLDAVAQHVLRVLSDQHVHKIPAKVDVFGETISFVAWDALSDAIRGELAPDGVTPEVVRRIDVEQLHGYVAKKRRTYAKRVLDYIEKESNGPLPVESGAYRDAVKKVKRGKKALEAMAEGLPPPRLAPEVARFFEKQLGHAFYACAPLNSPDAGYGLVALFLGVEAAMHAVGKSKDLQAANTAFDVFTSPLMETTEHMWPVLDAIDRTYAKQLRAEMEIGS